MILWEGNNANNAGTKSLVCKYNFRGFVTVTNCDYTSDIVKNVVTYGFIHSLLSRATTGSHQ